MTPLMNTRLLSSLGLALGVSGIAFAQSHYYFYNSNGGNVPVITIGGAIAESSGTTNFFSTPVLFDDVTSVDAVNPVLDFSGQRLSRVQFSVFNANTETVSARPTVTLMNAAHTTMTTPGGTPAPSGNIIDLAFTPIAFGTGLSLFNYTPTTATNVSLPMGKFWVGQSFYNAPSGTIVVASEAQLNNLGVALSTPNRGQSENVLFETTDSWWSFPYADPAGSFVSFTGSTPSNIYINLGVEGQDAAGSVSLSDVGSLAYTRTLTLTVKVGSTVLYTEPLVFGPSTSTLAVTATFPVTMPAGVSGPATLEIDGASFLKRVVSLPLSGFNGTFLPTQVFNGDVDNSGEVDASDIDMVIAHFGELYTADGPLTYSDVDVSGEVDAADIDIVIANFGRLDD